MGEIPLAAVAELSAQMTIVAGQIYPVSKPVGIGETVRSGQGKGIIFAVDPTLVDEAYTINIDKKKAVIQANSDNGFLYAIQTLKQLMPVSIYGNASDEKAKWELPCCEIKDKPRFAYRGMHLEIGRAHV